MKQYKEYKDSGIAWIGAIPSHWLVVNIKRVTEFCPQKREVLNKDTIVGYAPMERIRLGQILPLEICIKNLSSGLTYFEKGDIVVAKVTPCFENRNIAIVPEMVNYCGYGSSELFVYRSKQKKIITQYLFYFLQSSNFIEKGVSTMTGTGGLKRVSSEFARNFLLPLPPKAEQEAIVKYLDEKTEQINQYITLQEQQIQGLQELKQSIIARAVTRGLDPKAPLRPSGIAWIGDIPCHWQKLRCKDVLIENKELVGKDSDKYTLLSLSTRGVIIRDLSEGKGKFPKDFSTYKIVSPDNLVFCLFDVDETPRTVGYSQHKGMITGAYNIFSVKNTNISFLYHLFLSFDNRKSLKPLYKGLRKVIPLPSFMSMPIFLPPLEEQEAIVKYLDEKTEQINLLISKTEASIARMKEFKQSLIADAVTGRFKVPTLK